MTGYTTSKLVAAALLLWPELLPAQSAFDVASIHASRIARAGGEGSGREHVDVSPTGIRFVNVSLNFCIQWAYGVKFYQVSGPDWIVRERYDILAKTGQPVARPRLRRMLQALLADRFALQLHSEMRPRPVYALVVHGARAKLRLSAPGEETGTSVVDGSFVFSHVTMPELAERLSDLAAIDRPVLDATGIQGIYDLTLPSAARDMRQDPGSIFTAIEEAGLKLEPRKSPLQILVVDHASRPSPN